MTHPNLRLRAAAIHLGCSTTAALLASLLVFWVWYPQPFAGMAGGSALFLLLMTIDVLLGPALTAVVAGPRKDRAELRRDLAVIVIVQALAFFYGLYVMAQARPVALVFEIDLMRVIAAVDVDNTTLKEAKPGLRRLSWTGPQLIAAVKPTDPAEQLRTIELGLAGIPLAALPGAWREYELVSDAAWRAATPVDALIARYPPSSLPIGAIAASEGTSSNRLRFLPVVSRNGDWVVLLTEPNARPVGFLPLNGFL